MSHQQITATEELMRLAVNQQKNVDSLLGYYRDQIDKFNDERADWAIYYENCKNNATNQHLLERELGKVRSGIDQLESHLHLHKAQLKNQRQKYYDCLEENERVNARLEANQKKHRQLMSICKPIDFKTAHFDLSKTNLDSKKKKDASQKDSGNSRTTELELELINMSKAHEAKKHAMQSTTDKLKGELDQLVSQHSLRGANCSKEYKQALQRLIDLESRHMNLTTEFFRFRMGHIEDQQALQEQNEIIRLKNIALVQKLNKLQQTHSSQFKTVDAEVKRRNKEFKLKYDEELKNKQQHLSILKEQHERISDIYLNKIKKLEGELREMNHKYKTVDDKTRVEVNSIREQIRILSNRLEKEALRKMREEVNHEEPTDEDSESLEISELDQINQEVRNLEKKLGGTRV